MSRVKPLAWLMRLYISVMRGTPLMLQMFFIYFAPYYLFGMDLSTDSKFNATIVHSSSTMRRISRKFIAAASSPFRAANTKLPKCWAIRACRRL